MNTDNTPTPTDDQEANNTAGAGCMARLVRILFNRRRIEVTLDREFYTERPIYGDPVACPWCRGGRVRFINGWTGLASSEEPDYKVDLDEYQCEDCDGRSFWV